MGPVPSEDQSVRLTDPVNVKGMPLVLRFVLTGASRQLACTECVKAIIPYLTAHQPSMYDADSQLKC